LDAGHPGIPVIDWPHQSEVSFIALRSGIFPDRSEASIVRRREFISGIGVATAWPILARAQKSSAKRRIVVVGALAPGDVETVARGAAFEQALAALGWTKGDTIAIDYRWIGVNPALAEKRQSRWSHSRPTSSSRPATL
jgi:hypothetical protein